MLAEQQLVGLRAELLDGRRRANHSRNGKTIGVEHESQYRKTVL
jgi:hypothetical protein